MNKTTTILAAAVLSVGTYATSFAQNMGDLPDATKAEKQNNTADPSRPIPAVAGETVRAPSLKTISIRDGYKVVTPDSDGIRKTFATSAEAALSKNGFDNLVKRLVDADRNRIGQNMPDEQQLTVLNGRIDQIQAAWKSKYNKDFAFDDANRILTGQFSMLQSEIKEKGVLPFVAFDAKTNAKLNDVNKPVGEVPAPNPANPDDNAVQRAGHNVAESVREVFDGRNHDEDRNLDVGRSVAVASFVESHGLPAINVLLINEFPNSWKIDAPDRVNGKVLYDNLLATLTKIGDNTATWPADADEAMRYVDHAITLAVLDAKGDKDMRHKMDKMNDVKRDAALPAAMP